MVVKGGEFARTLMRWTGHSLDNDGNVVDVPDQQKHRFGGVEFYGWFPFYDIQLRLMRWTTVRENGELVEHEEVLADVLLMDLVYGIVLRGAEDKNGIPVDYVFLMPYRPVNPYKAMYKTRDYHEMVQAKIEPLLRHHVCQYAWQELAADRAGHGNKVSKLLKQYKELEELLNVYGILVNPDDIELKEVTPPAEYQRLAIITYEAEQEAKAVAITAKAKSQAAGAIIGAAQLEDNPKASELSRTGVAAMRAWRLPEILDAVVPLYAPDQKAHVAQKEETKE
jgi:hypothetical protein